MSKRFPNRPAVPDFHLWREVAETVRPLRRLRPKPSPRPPDEQPRPLSDASAPRPRRSNAVPMPAYRPDGKPGRPPGHGIEPRMKKRLQRGTLGIDGTLDLHGMRQAEARAALARFVHARVARGDRTILVITGKGLRKLDREASAIVEAGILRTMLPIWLGEPALAPMVAGWEPAAQAHGGEGAFYVRLRRSAALAR